MRKGPFATAAAAIVLAALTLTGCAASTGQAAGTRRVCNRGRACGGRHWSRVSFGCR